MVNKIQLQEAFQKNYNRILFAKEILNPVFGGKLNFFTQAIEADEKPSNSELKAIDKVLIYGKLNLDNGLEIICYEIVLQPCVRIEYSKIAIQRYVRKLLTSGQAALINFISPTYPNTWRLTLVAKDSVWTDKGAKEKNTHPKRYTFLLGSAETCRTAAERFEILSMEHEITVENLVKAFSVERLSKTFFDEYKLHYSRIVKYLQDSNFKQSAFSNNDKAIRDYTKKLLGRLVFLYFVQKKGWLGASNLDYKDGDLDFLANLFHSSGGNETFYPNWLRVLFFETLNTKRTDDNFILPNGKTVKIPFLNGGLFDKEDHDEFLYVFEPTLFHNPENDEDPNMRGFFDFLGAYNFTVYEDSPDDHTIAVDPEMLGHIFENLLEDNKDKGAFYTPKEIVHFMCQESLIEYLATHLSKEFTLYKKLGSDQIELFGNESKVGQLDMLEEIGDKALNHEDVERIVLEKDINGLEAKQLKYINSLLDSVKICDPAIGSGAFPMGLLQEIFSIKELIAFELNDEWKPDIVKANIIQNSIYGVDIEKGAVDIARLRFWLSLVVDENKPHPLPNLDYKIVSGDSLVAKFENDVIEIDWGIDTTKDGIFGQELLIKKIELLKTISTKQKQYFLPENLNKKALSAEIRSLKLDLLINQFELMVRTKGLETQPRDTSKKAKEQMELYLVTQGWKRTIEKLQALKRAPEKPFYHFDWKLDFPEILNPNLVKSNSGFDIVIGNPPYIQLQKLGEYADILEKANYKTFIRTGDIYGLFYELGLSLLKENGILSFITSNKWMRAGYGVTLRKFFAEETNPVKLVDFGGFQVFETATVDTNILVTQKAKNKNSTETCLLNKSFQRQKKLSVFVRQQGNHCEFNTAESWVILSPIEKSIKEKIEKVGTPLKDWDIQINYGIKTGFNEAFIISGEKRLELIKQDPKSAEIIRPILRGRDIKRYGYDFADLWLINTHNGIRESGINPININDFPAVKRHLDNYYPELEKRQDKGTTAYNLRNCAYMDDFSKQKIIWIELVDKGRFAFDDNDGYITLNGTFIMIGNDLEYICSILNNPITSWHFNTFCISSGVGTNQWRELYVKELFIPKFSDTNKQSILNIFQEIRHLEKQKNNSFEKQRELNFLVYNLLELNEEEIAFIESQ